MLRKLLLAVLYTALTLGANPARATDPVVDLAPLITGEMRKLIVTDPPAPLPDALLTDGAGAEIPLAGWKGQWLVVNFWATWCAPCRREMPSLDRLQTALPALAVLPIATGRNDPAAIARFYEEAAISALPTLRDPQSALARQLGVLGLPVTLIVNPEGQEVARLIGDAAWDSPEAIALLTALTAP